MEVIDFRKEGRVQLPQPLTSMPGTKRSSDPESLSCLSLRRPLEPVPKAREAEVS